MSWAVAAAGGKNGQPAAVRGRLRIAADRCGQLWHAAGSRTSGGEFYTFPVAEPMV